MKRLVILIAVMCVCLGINAQADSTMRFGYLSYGEALQSMHDYTVVQQKLADLRQQFQNETLRAEDEFNRKYVSATSPSPSSRSASWSFSSSWKRTSSSRSIVGWK